MPQKLAFFRNPFPKSHRVISVHLPENPAAEERVFEFEAVSADYIAALY